MVVYADDAGIVSQSPGRLGNTMGGDCEGVHGFRPRRVRSQDGDNVPARKGHANDGIQRPHCRPSIRINGQICISCHGGTIIGTPNISVEIARRVQCAWGRYQRYTYEFYRRPTADLRLKVRMLAVEAVEAILYGYMTWARYSLQAGALGPSCTPTPLYRITETKPHRPCSVLLRRFGESGL